MPLDPAREAAVATLFDKAKDSPPHLRVFLRTMPKGGDLHNHLSGAIYAEDVLAWAAQQGFCVGTDGVTLAAPPCPEEKSVARLGATDEFGYDRLIHALSTRGWQRGVGRNDVTGHTQFFSTFGRFGAVTERNAAAMLVAARRIAAGDHLSYLELDHDTVTLSAAVQAAPNAPFTEADLPARFAAETRELSPLIARARAELDADEASVRKTMACGTDHAEPGCSVAVHYLFQGFRALPPALVFRSLVLGFMMADANPRYVGINIVMPEDAMPALRDYDLHMAMIRFLADRFPRVRRTLHAGELTLGLVAPQHLRDHIARAIDAGAQRIGHGTDIAFEDDAESTMARMARDGIAVEINLTSNDVILGVKGADHPLKLYRDHGVPFVLSTDDQGVLRTDMTAEYVRAARDQGLTYADLKQAARASLHYAFIPGASLWADLPTRRVAAPCAADIAAPGCAQLLKSSEKARLQLDLERQLADFEVGRLALAGRSQNGL